MLTALIIGAGATGRGFVAPLLARNGYVVDFVECNGEVRARFSGRDAYWTASTDSTQYTFHRVSFRRIEATPEAFDIAGYDVVFTAVGPRNCRGLAPNLRCGKIILLENDAGLAEELRSDTGNLDIYHGIPDAVTSNTAPPALLSMDPLCVVSERGNLIMPDGVATGLAGDGIEYVSGADFGQRWICKFYIHNASHAVVAYLGAARGCTYIHEAMQDPDIHRLVTSAIVGVTAAVVRAGLVDDATGQWYMARELARYRNSMLVDPISRVARDPARKLDPRERLFQALERVQEQGLDAAPWHEAIRAARQYAHEIRGSE